MKTLGMITVNQSAVVNANAKQDMLVMQLVVVSRKKTVPYQLQRNCLLKQRQRKLPANLSAEDQVDPTPKNKRKSLIAKTKK